MQFTPEQFRRAIMSIENRSGQADLVHPPAKNGDHALGLYGVMSKNLPEWSQEALGRTVSEKEFLQNPDLQHKIFDTKFGSYVDKYGTPEDAASVWFSGKPLSQVNPKASDGITTVPEYISKFQAALGRTGADGMSNDLGTPVSVGTVPVDKVPGLLASGAPDPATTTPAADAAKPKDDPLSKDQLAAFDSMGKALQGGGSAPIQSMFQGDTSQAAMATQLQRMQMAQQMFMQPRPRGLLG